jgi:hypothetical protein
MTGPQDPAAAGRGRLRAGHADREQAIDTLKTAFVHGQLTKDELDARAGQALAARTYADLAALTADISPRKPAARPTRPPAPARGRPLASAAAKSGVCLIIAAAATRVLGFLVADDGHYHGIPGANPPYESWAPLALVLAAAAIFAAIGIMGNAVVTSLQQRRSRRQLPPRPGGHTPQAERRGGTGHGPVPPGPRTNQAQADLRARKSPQRQRHLPTRAGCCWRRSPAGGLCSRERRRPGTARTRPRPPARTPAQTVGPASAADP